MSREPLTEKSYRNNNFIRFLESYKLINSTCQLPRSQIRSFVKSTCREVLGLFDHITNYSFYIFFFSLVLLVSFLLNRSLVSLVCRTLAWPLCINTVRIYWCSHILKWHKTVMNGASAWPVGDFMLTRGLQKSVSNDGHERFTLLICALRWLVSRGEDCQFMTDIMYTVLHIDCV